MTSLLLFLSTSAKGGCSDDVALAYSPFCLSSDMLIDQQLKQINMALTSNATSVSGINHIFKGSVIRRRMSEVVSLGSIRHLNITCVRRQGETTAAELCFSK